MTKYQRIEGYYKAGLWSAKRVREAAACGYITSEEAARILALPPKKEETE